MLPTVSVCRLVMSRYCTVSFLEHFFLRNDATRAMRENNSKVEGESRFITTADTFNILLFRHVLWTSSVTDVLDLNIHQSQLPKLLLARFHNRIILWSISISWWKGYLLPVKKKITGSNQNLIDAFMLKDLFFDLLWNIFMNQNTCFTEKAPGPKAPLSKNSSAITSKFIY